MLKSIRIKNYKLFKDFSLKNLPQILLIGGKNNCGKTSVLESVFLPLDCADPAMFMKHLGWRGLNTLSNNAESLFAPAHHNFNLNQPIVFGYTINKSQKTLEYKFLPAMSTSFIVEDKGNDIKFPKDLSKELGRVKISYSSGGKNTHQAFLKHTATGLQLEGKPQELIQHNEGTKCVFIHSNIPNTQDNYVRIYSELDRINNTTGIIQALQILEPNLKSLSLIELKNLPVLHGDIGIGKKIPLALMGHGIDHLVSILLSISDASDGVALIDDMESGFHYSFLPRMWKIIATYAKINNTQIIATTQSRELISGAKEGIPSELKDDFQYMRIERNENEFKAKTYDFELLSTALETDLAIR